jgi:hypothetical protein
MLVMIEQTIKTIVSWKARHYIERKKGLIVVKVQNDFKKNLRDMLKKLVEYLMLHGMGKKMSGILLNFI